MLFLGGHIHDLQPFRVVGDLGVVPGDALLGQGLAGGVDHGDAVDLVVAVHPVRLPGEELVPAPDMERSEERRVGKECRL